MLIRIVRMTFREDKVEEFLDIFNRSKHDKNAPNIMLTYSHWASEEHLNAYRDSILFKTTWAATKALFADKPVAFSSEVLEIL
jgi:quinol monooxygenase YgiN